MTIPESIATMCFLLVDIAPSHSCPKIDSQVRCCHTVRRSSYCRCTDMMSADLEGFDLRPSRSQNGSSRQVHRLSPRTKNNPHHDHKGCYSPLVGQRNSYCHL